MTKEEIDYLIRNTVKNAMMDTAEEEKTRLLAEFEEKLNSRKMEIAARLASFLEIKLLDHGITGYTIQIIVKGMDSRK